MLDFIGQHPYLTVILVWIVGAYLVELVRAARKPR